MPNNSRKKSGVWKGVAIFLAIVIVLGAAYVTPSAILNKWNPADWFTPAEEQPIADGGMIISEPEEHGVSLMSTNIAPEEYADYGISAMAESAQQVTATITPSNAANKTVDWSIEFANDSSDWATGKTVTDYVTVTPTSDGALTANVVCLQAFAEQIIITAASRGNPDIKGTCTVDYAQKYAGTSTSLYFTSSSDYNQGGIVTNTTDDIITTVNVPLRAETGYNTNTAAKQSIRYSSSLSDIYTIAFDDTAVDFKYYIKLNSEFLSALKSQSALSSSTFAEDWTLFDETTCNVSEADAEGFNSTEEYCVIDYFRALCSGLTAAVAPEVYYFNSTSLNQFIEAAQDYISSYHYEIKIVATVNETDYETVTQVRFTESSLNMHITGIDVSPDLVF